MNRGTINSSAINADALNVIQRAIVRVNAYAQTSIIGRVLRRSPLVTTPRESATIAPRAMVRGQVSSTPQAKVSMTGLQRIHTKLSIVARSVISITGAQYPRHYYSQAMSVLGTAIMRLTGRALIRSPLVSSAQARITLAQPNSYQRYRGIMTLVARASITINPEVRKQIPYDADAPAERTIYLQPANRFMVV